MQRQFVDMDEKCKNALSSIKVQLNSRWDALLALAKTASAYAKHESETIIQTIQQRRQVGGSNPTVKDIRNQQAGLADVMNRLMVISEAYPELKASELFVNTQESVKQYEENVRLSRMVYNDTVTIFNRNVRQWPSSFVASLLHFGEREYLETDEEKKQNMPELFS
jgi:LemA protein